MDFWIILGLVVLVWAVIGTWLVIKVKDICERRNTPELNTKSIRLLVFIFWPILLVCFLIYFAYTEIKKCQ